MPRFTLPIFQSNVKGVASAMSKYGFFTVGWNL